MPSRPTPAVLVNLGALAGALLLLSSSKVRAADEAPAADVPPLPRYLRIEYRKPATKSCPDQGELENEVIYNARRNPFKGNPAGVLHVVVEQRGALFVGRFEVRDGEGHVISPREVDPDRSCLKVVERIGLIAGEMLRDPYPPRRPPPPPPRHFLPPGPILGQRMSGSATVTNDRGSAPG